MSTPNRAPATGALAERVTALMGAPCRSIRSIAGGSICRSFQLVGDDGQVAFAKWLPDAPVDLFAAEAESLRWLRAAGAVEIPEVLGVDDEAIALTWIEQAPPTSARAAAFGRALAAMHAAGASGFGAGWTAYAGAIAMPNGPAADWPTFLGGCRIEPLLRAAVDSGGLASPKPVERVLARLPLLVDASEPPARLHGDLWSGNVLFTDSAAALVDPSATGGHREMDIAMLSLFGAPYLDAVLTAYDEVNRLSDGWRERLGVHQLVPLLAHAAIFGGRYGVEAIAMAERYA